MDEAGNQYWVFKTTIPYVDFNYRKFSDNATIPAVLFAQSMEEIDRFLFFLRGIYHYFEPFTESVISGFLLQLQEETDPSLKEDFQEIFRWSAREKLVAELILSKIVN